MCPVFKEYVDSLEPSFSDTIAHEVRFRDEFAFCDA